MLRIWGPIVVVTGSLLFGAVGSASADSRDCNDRYARADNYRVYPVARRDRDDWRYRDYRDDRAYRYDRDDRDRDYRYDRRARLQEEREERRERERWRLEEARERRERQERYRDRGYDRDRYWR